MDLSNCRWLERPACRSREIRWGLIRHEKFEEASRAAGDEFVRWMEILPQSDGSGVLQESTSKSMDVETWSG